MHRPLGERAYRAFSKVVHNASWRLQLAEYALGFVEKEMASNVRVPWRFRPGLWRRGFLTESRVLYRLDVNDASGYVTDYERFVRSRLINGPNAIFLDDKLLFARLMERFPDRVPALYGMLTGGQVVMPSSRSGPGLTLADLLHREKALVLKPHLGGGGTGFARIEQDGAGTTLHDGRPIGADAFADLTARAEGHMVCAFVRQHPVIAALYPQTTNTIRLVTMQDDHTPPFIARAILRIGSACSAPTDNWTRGGLSAVIDGASGALGRAAPYPSHSDKLRWYPRHPETGTQIEGMCVPHWDMIRREILDIAAAFPFLRYVGWDIAVTQDGFAVIEGNHFTDVNLLQIHGPLLTDDAVAAFFRRYRIGDRRGGRERPQAPK